MLRRTAATAGPSLAAVSARVAQVSPLSRSLQLTAAARGGRWHSARWVRASSSTSPASAAGAPDGDHQGQPGSSTELLGAERLAGLLRDDPELCARVANSVDARTAARFALTFSKAAGAKGAIGDDEQDPDAAPTRSQLRQLFVRTAVPFVGFGFFDNVIMLTVGETIDCTLGVAFGFSTLAAAGMGQMVSDASGITLQGLIERSADQLGLPDPHLSVRQQRLEFVKYWMIAARIIGIIFGCFLGMCPLILMPERVPRLVDQIAEKLSPAHRAEFNNAVRTETHKAGDKLLKYGEISEKVFLIQKGNVEVIGRDMDGGNFKVTSLGPGNAFGVPALKWPSRVDLVVPEDEEVVVQVIDKPDFLRLTQKSEEALELFKEARSQEHQVYLRTHGATFHKKVPEAKKGTGKTRTFAAMDQKSRMEVLALTGKPIDHFIGAAGEGKVNFFAALTEAEKADALHKWQQQQLPHYEGEHEQEEAAPEKEEAAPEKEDAPQGQPEQKQTP